MRLNLLIFTLLALLLVCVYGAENYYQLLGVPRNADSDEIRKAYRKLSKKYHPDRNPDEHAKDMYMRVNNAYEVLSDPEKKAIYDQGGEEALKRKEQQQNAHDPFAAFFGGGARREQQNKGAPVYVEMPVTLAELYTGVFKQLVNHRWIRCPHCHGTGADSPTAIKTCPVCGGRGMVVERRQLGPGIIQQIQAPCSHCGGVGQSITETCHLCHGDGLIRGSNRLHINVLAGSSYGDEIVLAEEGDESKDHDAIAGDVIVRLVPANEESPFRRDGDDLYVSIGVSLAEALLGFRREFKHLDGHTVVISSDTVTQPNQVIRVSEEGMPRTGTLGLERGDLHVQVKLKLPRVLNEEQKKAAEAFA